MHRLTILPCGRIDWRQTVPLIVEHPQLLQVVGWHHMLRFLIGREIINNLVRVGINDVNGVADTIGDVEARGEIPDDWAELVRACFGIEVVRIKYRGHAREWLIWGK